MLMSASLSQRQEIIDIRQWERYDFIYSSGSINVLWVDNEISFAAFIGEGAYDKILIDILGYRAVLQACRSAESR